MDVKHSLILRPHDCETLFRTSGGGKAAHLAGLTKMGMNVPNWICLSCDAIEQIEDVRVQQEIEAALSKEGLLDGYVAVRSSAIGEDSANCSFAGIHSSYLFQTGWKAILDSIRKCRDSCRSERAIEYRKQQGLSSESIRTAVVVQRMVCSEISGVAFSRSPLNLFDRNRVVINAAWGVGEGLVSGDLEGDLFSVDRTTFEILSKLAVKEDRWIQGSSGGLEKAAVSQEKQKEPCLSDEQIREIAKAAISLEKHYGRPQDVEWAFAGGILYCLQTRPVTTLPPSSYYDHLSGALLWDNSNIVESYSGVTTPLTFSFASFCYEEVYRQFCRLIGAPREIVESYDSYFRNMLGLIRGRIYYNLVNWYRLAVLLPGAGANREFMETMMGVKQALTPEIAAEIGFPDKPPGMSAMAKIKLFAVSIWRFLRIEAIIRRFYQQFDAVYAKARQRGFKEMSLQELIAFYRELAQTVLKRWQAPIVNDCICMIFFGLLKKICKNWIGSDSPSLQNDLLCGEGGLESAEPTKMLMRIAEAIDRTDAPFREWFLQAPVEEIAKQMKERFEPIHRLFEEFLEKYGFRCVDELKLESKDLHEDAGFVIDALVNYVRMKTYSFDQMEIREKEIRDRAEKKAFAALKGWRKQVFRFVLKHARKAIRNRENMRFSRTKIFGVVRHLFRAVGYRFAEIGVLRSEGDIFYLTVDEIFAYAEGRSADLDLIGIAERRKGEFEGFQKALPPPDRLVTLGPVCSSLRYPQLLLGSGFGEATPEAPNCLSGTPCCPGIVEGIVRVVRELKDARRIDGEILVTEKTDPGWVPLYPSCAGLLIERGSLLSHSAVVARELGLPTIVGISGGLMRKLQTGMKVRMDGAKGTVEIL